MVDSTSDCAFAVDTVGAIVAWNQGAERMFGVAVGDAIGKRCGEIVQGMDACGPVCSPNCTVQQATRKRQPLTNFDLQVKTPAGMQWCNVSVITVTETLSGEPYAVHILRWIDIRKRLEILIQDFVVNGTGISLPEARMLATVSRAPAQGADLSNREVEILRLLAAGRTTATIATQLSISRTTVNNHIQHILEKLDVHSRLEAIRRAESAGLI